MQEHNRFCVNDKTCGSCWGTLLINIEELNILAKDTSAVMVYLEELFDWNGKNYMWFKDMQYDKLTGDNYFLEIK